MLTTTILAMGILLACMAAAAWPLLLIPRLRAILACTGGSCCIGAGAIAMGLVTSGLLAVPGLERIAAADEASEEITVEVDEPAVAPVVDAPAAESPTTEAAATEAVPAATTATESEAQDTVASETTADDSSAAPAATEPVSLPAPASDPVIDESAFKVIIPDNRPAWTSAKPVLSGTTHTIPVASGAYAKDIDARHAFDEALVEETRDYIAEQLGSDLAPHFVTYSARQIKERFVRPENIHDDVATYSVGPMHEYFALVEFGPDFRREIDARWQAVRGQSRLLQFGLLAGAGLLLLSTMFGYFRLDNATRGYYTGRLQFLAAATILAVIGAGAIMARWITWM
jgi:hypothetical protein